MFYLSIWIGFIIFNGFTTSSTIIRRSNNNDSTSPIHLGDFKPTCSNLSDSNFGDINSGINLTQFKVRVFFFSELHFFFSSLANIYLFLILGTYGIDFLHVW